MKNLSFLIFLTCLGLTSTASAKTPGIAGKTWVYDGSVCANGTTFNYFDSVSTKNNSWTLRVGERNFSQNYKFNGGKCALHISGDAIYSNPENFIDGLLTLTDRKVGDDHMQNCYISYKVEIPSTTQYSFKIQDGKLSLTEAVAPGGLINHLCGVAQRTHFFH